MIQRGASGAGLDKLVSWDHGEFKNVTEALEQLSVRCVHEKGNVLEGEQKTSLNLLTYF